VLVGSWAPAANAANLLRISTPRHPSDD